MEFRPARLAAMALIALLAACQVPTPKEASDGPHRGAPLREAPSNLEDANAQLAALAEPVRTERALQWARYYLVNQRAQDASDLLDRIADSAQSQDQRYRWLWLRAQCWLALQKPERALELLDGSPLLARRLVAQEPRALAAAHLAVLALPVLLDDAAVDVVWVHLRGARNRVEARLDRRHEVEQVLDRHLRRREHLLPSIQLILQTKLPLLRLLLLLACGLLLPNSTQN